MRACVRLACVRTVPAGSCMPFVVSAAGVDRDSPVVAECGGGLLARKTAESGGGNLAGGRAPVGRRDVRVQSNSFCFVEVSVARMTLPLAVYIVRRQAARAQNGREGRWQPGRGWVGGMFASR